MNTISILLYPLIAFIGLFILELIGFSASTFMERSPGRPRAERIAENINLGLGILVLLTFLGATAGLNRMPILYSVLILLAIGALIVQSKIREYFLILNSNSIYLVGVGVGIGTWELLPGLFFASKHKTVLTTVGFGNNDIAYYIAMASHFDSHGLIHSTNLANNDLGTIVKYNYFSPTAVLGLISTISHLPVWRISMAALILASSIACCNLVRLIKLFTNPRTSDINIVLLTIFIFTSSLMSYCYIRYFLGQIIAIGISAGLISVTYKLVVKKEKRLITYAEFISLILLSCFTYPHILLFILSIALGTFTLDSLCRRKLLRREILNLFTCFLISVIILLPYFPYGYKLLLTTIHGENGWPVSILSPYNLLLNPSAIGQVFTNSTLIFVWLVFLILLIATLHRIQKLSFREPVYLLIFSLLLSCFIILLARGRPLTEYSSWKLIAYYLPLIVALVGSILIAENFSRFLLLTLVIVTMSTSILQWKFVSPAQNNPIVSQDFSKAANEINRLNLRYVNVDLPTYFETMMSVSLIRNSKIFLNSASYFQIARRPESCVLQRADLVPNGTRTYKLSEDYVLTGNIPKCLYPERVEAQ